MEIKLVRDNLAARKTLGKMKTKHWRCSARVLRDGRCAKNCPFCGESHPGNCGPHGKVINIDHERLVNIGEKTFYICHNHSQPEGEYLTNVKNHCTFHALSFEIVQTKNTHNPSVSDWNVCTALVDKEGACQ